MSKKTCDCPKCQLPEGDPVSFLLSSRDLYLIRPLVVSGAEKLQPYNGTGLSPGDPRLDELLTPAEVVAVRAAYYHDKAVEFFASAKPMTLEELQAMIGDFDDDPDFDDETCGSVH